MLPFLFLPSIPSSMTTTDKLLGFLAIILVCSTLIYTFKPDHNLDGSTGISVSGK
jgi:hypothetical protein